MGSSFRVKIGEREVKAMQPNTILWDLEVKGFVARRQFSEVITFSVVYRTKENVQRWQKLERYPILTAHLAGQEAIRVLRAKAMDKTLPLRKWPSGALLQSRNSVTNIKRATTAKSLRPFVLINPASKST